MTSLPDRIQTFITEETDPTTLPHSSAAAFDLLREAADTIKLLSRWKAEALTALSQWEAAWEAAGNPGPLGVSKASTTTGAILSLRVQIAAVKGYLADPYFASSEARNIREDIMDILR